MLVNLRLSSSRGHFVAFARMIPNFRVANYEMGHPRLPVFTGHRTETAVLHPILPLPSRFLTSSCADGNGDTVGLPMEITRIVLR